jgi:protein-S-isoprenylcysteine O-methyltransferase Ste14
MANNDQFTLHLGTTLVAMQFALLPLLAGLALPAFLAGRAPIGAWLCALLGVLLGLWALSSNRLGNFNIRPAPRAGGQLIQQGPYRWIRHPMYTAVIAVGVACAWASAHGVVWLALCALTGVLVVKAVFEEHWMLQAHPGYAAYRQRTRRFLPWLF